MKVSDYTYLRWFYQQIVTYSLSARQFFPLLLRRNRIGLRLEREIREARTALHSLWPPLATKRKLCRRGRRAGPPTAAMGLPPLLKLRNTVLGVVEFLEYSQG